MGLRDEIMAVLVAEDDDCDAEMPGDGWLWYSGPDSAHLSVDDLADELVRVLSTHIKVTAEKERLMKRVDL